jgi:hypothetical protein
MTVTNITQGCGTSRWAAMAHPQSCEWGWKCGVPCRREIPHQTIEELVVLDFFCLAAAHYRTFPGMIFVLGNRLQPATNTALLAARAVR